MSQKPRFNSNNFFFCINEEEREIGLIGLIYYWLWITQAISYWAGEMTVVRIEGRS